MLAGGALSLFGPVTLSFAAMAAPADAISVRVELVAPNGCSSVEAFYAEVRARSERVRRADDDEPAIAIRVRLERAGGKVEGELSIVDAEGATDTRTVDGASCDEVVQALALTAALALDPSARLDAGPVAKAEPPPPEKPAPSPPPPAPVRPEPDVGMRFGLELGAHAALAEIVSPYVNVGLGISARATERGGRLFSPSFGASLVHLRNEVFGEDEAAVRWTALAVTACPVAWTPSSFALRPCAFGSGGWISASGRAVTPRSAGRSWWSLGALLRASAALGRRSALELEGGLSAPLLRRRFVVTEPEQEVGSTPALSAFGSLGASYRF